MIFSFLLKVWSQNSDLNAKTPTLQERYLTADTQTLSSDSTTTLWDSEVTIPFDCIMIGNWKVLCKSSDANASFYYMVKNAYVQGREQWDGTVQTDNTINIFVMNKFTKGTTLSVSVQGNCSIRGNNISLTRYNFTFIPLQLGQAGHYTYSKLVKLPYNSAIHSIPSICVI